MRLASEFNGALQRVCNDGAIDHQIGYLAQLDKEVTDALARSLSLEETVKAVAMPEYSAYKLFPWVHAQINVPKAYGELKAGK